VHGDKPDAPPPTAGSGEPVSGLPGPGGDARRAGGGRYYVPQLDGLRFLAFFLVFTHHLPATAPFFEPGTFLHGASATFRVIGSFGVDLFLVLSGFLITTLLVLEHHREGRVSLKDFYLRRTLRIWPLYYFALLLGFLVLPLFGLMQAPIGTAQYSQMVALHLFPFVTFLGNYSIGLLGYPPSWMLGHLWTISLEEQFYLLWPVLFFFLFARGKVLAVTLGLLLVFTVVSRGYFVLSPFPHPFVWTAFLTRLDPFILGSALGILRVAVPADPRWGLPKVAVGVGLVLAVTLAPPYQAQTGHVLWQYLAVAAGFCLILDAAVSGGLVGRALAVRPLVEAGKLCYGLYVYHHIVIGVSEQAVSGLLGPGLQSAWGGWLTWLTQFCIALAATGLLAYVSYHALERPFLRLRLRFSHVPSRPV